MPESISSGPFIWLYLFLLVVVFTRAQATYWLGYYIASRLMKNVPEEGWRRTFYDWSQKDAVTNGIATLHRRGWIIIPLSFLTVGFQTIIQLSAGLTRMVPINYTAAMFPGCLVWALIYSTIGFSMWNALIAAFAGSPAGIATLIILIVAIALWVKFRKKAQEKLIND
ncbi:DedA family protein [Flaviflexus massiliensis]|uniref:DedA family protein n=1 Tax=Flaviflexus massiliensis TaxID=1522309 RepID=UPI0006D56BAC|nr:VTT domain-containing protein [Flaviflexus massiliensis]